MKAMVRISVPLWVAFILKSQDKCRIVPPDWLNLVYLNEKYDEEIKNPNIFSSLPYNWIETSKLFLSKAFDDLSDSANQLRSILQDLRELRQSKTKRGLLELNESNMQLNNLSILEINEIRPFIINSMGQLFKFYNTKKLNSND